MNKDDDKNKEVTDEERTDRYDDDNQMTVLAMSMNASDSRKKVEVNDKNLEANENISPNIIAIDIPMCKYEEIRLSIITERQQRMAESNISEDLFEAKRDVLQDQRQAINKAKKSKKKNEVNEMRRSGRIKQKEDKCNELVDENFVDEVATNYDDKIDVPDSDEVGTKVVPNNLNIKLEIKVEILTEEESKNYVTHDSDSAVSVNTSDVDSTAVIEQLLAELMRKVFQL